VKFNQKSRLLILVKDRTEIKKVFSRTSRSSCDDVDEPEELPGDTRVMKTAWAR